jgi:hypothetical protein
LRPRAAGEHAVVTSDERKLQNELIFRDANERIRRAQAAMEIAPAGPVPFICECADVACHTIVRMAGDEYESLRAADDRFLIAPGHDAADGEIVDRRDGYWVVKKG